MKARMAGRKNKKSFHGCKKKSCGSPDCSCSLPLSVSEEKGLLLCPLCLALELASILVPASPQTHTHPSLSTTYDVPFVGPLLSVGNCIEKGSSSSSFLLPHSRGLLFLRHSRSKETAAIELRVPRVSLFGNENGFFCGGALCPSHREQK